MTTATNSEYAAATTADSVGVKMPNRSPRMMMNGKSSAQKPETIALATSFNDFLGGGALVSLRTCHHQAKASARPISSPGTMPARNSLEIDRLAATPKITKPMLGGITGPMIPEAAISPLESLFSWPAATIMGTSSAESAAASATAEPDNADSMQAARIA